MVSLRTVLKAVCVCALVTGMSWTPILAEPPGIESGMLIADGHVVSLEYTLTLQNKEVLDTNVGGDPIRSFQGWNTH